MVNNWVSRSLIAFGLVCMVLGSSVVGQEKKSCESCDQCDSSKIHTIEIAGGFPFTGIDLSFDINLAKKQEVDTKAKCECQSDIPFLNNLPHAGALFKNVGVETCGPHCKFATANRTNTDSKAPACCDADKGCAEGQCCPAEKCLTDKCCPGSCCANGTSGPSEKCCPKSDCCPEGKCCPDDKCCPADDCLFQLPQIQLTGHTAATGVTGMLPPVDFSVAANEQMFELRLENERLRMQLQATQEKMKMVEELARLRVYSQMLEQRLANQQSGYRPAMPTRVLPPPQPYQPSPSVNNIPRPRYPVSHGWIQNPALPTGMRQPLPPNGVAQPPRLPPCQQNPPTPNQPLKTNKTTLHVPDGGKILFGGRIVGHSLPSPPAMLPPVKVTGNLEPVTLSCTDGCCKDSKCQKPACNQPACNQPACTDSSCKDRQVSELQMRVAKLTEELSRARNQPTKPVEIGVPAYGQDGIYFKRVTLPPAKPKTSGSKDEKKDETKTFSFYMGAIR